MQLQSSLPPVEPWAYCRCPALPACRVRLLPLPLHAGIGPKVAACVALFSLDKHAAIPVDTHVWQIAVRTGAHAHVFMGVLLGVRHACMHATRYLALQPVGDLAQARG